MQMLTININLVMVKYVLSFCCFLFFVVGELQAQSIEIDVDRELKTENSKPFIFYLLKETDTIRLIKDSNNRYPVPISKEDSNSYISILWETENYYYEANIGSGIFDICSFEFHTKKTSNWRQIRRLIFKSKIPSYHFSFCKSCSSVSGPIKLHKRNKK